MYDQPDTNGKSAVVGDTVWVIIWLMSVGRWLVFSRTGGRRLQVVWCFCSTSSLKGYSEMFVVFLFFFSVKHVGSEIIWRKHRIQRLPPNPAQNVGVAQFQRDWTLGLS